MFPRAGTPVEDESTDGVDPDPNDDDVPDENDPTPIDPPDGPNAVDDAATTPLATPVSIDVLANDTHPTNDPLTIVSTTPPSNGSVVIDDGGTPGDPSDDTVTYTPNPGFTGTDTFTYTIQDPAGNQDTATVTVNVGDFAPVAVDDTATTDIGTPVSVDVLANDSDPQGQPLTIVSTTPPSNGSAVIDDGGTPGDPSDDTVTYTPNPGFTGTDTFTYTVSDGNGGLGYPATVTVTVDPVNDQAPVAVDDTATTPSGDARHGGSCWRTTAIRKGSRLTIVTTTPLTFAPRHGDRRTGRHVG